MGPKPPPAGQGEFGNSGAGVSVSVVAPARADPRPCKFVSSIACPVAPSIRMLILTVWHVLSSKATRGVCQALYTCLIFCQFLYRVGKMARGVRGGMT